MCFSTINVVHRRSSGEYGMASPLGCTVMSKCTSNAVRLRMWLRQGCDVVKDPLGHDILQTGGMLWSLRQALRLRDGGFGLLAIPCNSFGFMSSSQHCRTCDKPYGNNLLWWVMQGTTIAARACLIIAVLICRSCFWMVENPDRSMLAVFPPLVHIMSIPEILPLRVHWPLGCSHSSHHVHVIRISAYSSIDTHVNVIACMYAKHAVFYWGTWAAGDRGHWSLKWAMEMRWVLRNLYWMVSYVQCLLLWGHGCLSFASASLHTSGCRSGNVLWCKTRRWWRRLCPRRLRNHQCVSLSWGSVHLPFMSAYVWLWYILEHVIWGVGGRTWLVPQTFLETLGDLSRSHTSNLRIPCVVNCVIKIYHPFTILSAVHARSEPQIWSSWLVVGFENLG